MARYLEDHEQIALFQWRDLFSVHHPELRLMYHIPNGGSRDKREAAKLKRMGVKAGVSDIYLPVARGGKNGLYIELKAGRNRVTPEQQQFIEDVRQQGYAAEVCYGWEAAARVILQYLRGHIVTREDIVCMGGDL